MRVLRRIRHFTAQCRLVALTGLLGLIVATVSCRRQNAPASQIATPPPIPLSLEVRVTHSRDGFRSHEFTIMEHRFATTSGGRATYDVGGLHLTVQPTANGDRTITTVASFSDEKAGSTTESFSMTSIEGQSTTHQIGDLRITFGATTDPGRIAFLKAIESASTFVEGYYSWPSGEDFQFLHGQFIDYNYYSAPQGRLADRRVGPYRVDGEGIILRVDGTKIREAVLYHRVVEGVHLLLDEKALPYVDAKRPLPANDKYCVYILRPEGGARSLRWWQELLGTHPTMAEIFLHYRDANRSWHDRGLLSGGEMICIPP